MKKKIPSKFVSRLILSKIKDGKKFHSCMREYLSSKEFYLIKENNLQNLNFQSLSKKLTIQLNQFSMNVRELDIEYIMRSTNKLNLLLIILRSNIFQLMPQKEISLNHFSKYLFESKLTYSEKIQVNRLSPYRELNTKFKINNVIEIIAPVCPDYSYELASNGKYRYTFEKINNGIGLVAQKAIDSCQYIKSEFDLVDLQINISILLGDFEANQSNLSHLNETKESFLKKLEKSANEIKSQSNFNTEFFTKLCGGLGGWNNLIQMIKNDYKLNTYSDLKKLYPMINHDKNLISRMPLYTKWYPNCDDYSKIFYDQCLEYMLMGYLIESYYGNNMYLLASDHKAMRPYYGLLSNISIISSYSEY